MTPVYLQDSFGHSHTSKAGYSGSPDVSEGGINREVGGTVVLKVLLEPFFDQQSGCGDNFRCQGKNNLQ